MIAMLILYAKFVLKYDLTFGDAYRDPRVHGEVGINKSYSSAYSNHKRRLAVDFNIFVDGQYVTADKYYKSLHKFWSLIGGITLNDDLNHFSILYKGYS